MTSDTSNSQHRLRRWLIGLAVGALLLAGYGVALQHFGDRLGDGVEASLRTAPVTEDTQHAAR